MKKIYKIILIFFPYVLVFFFIYKLIYELLDSNNDNKNVYNQNLEICGTNPMTGFYRDGYCNTGSDDLGTHTVCATMTDEFLNFTKSKGNDLSTPRGSFPGLKSGDNWCLCALRWKQAYENNIAPPVNLEATHQKTLDYVNLINLQE